MGLALFGLAIFLLECWIASVPPRGFHGLPQWARLVMPAVFAVAAFRESQGKRSVWVATAVMFAFMLNRDSFANGVWLHPVVWACSAYLIFVGLTGRAPARFENRRLLLSVVAVVVGFVAAWVVGLVWLR